ncbi:MAG: HAMP domain-containing histidine kinase, partial [Desulfatitalea sp.]|nr:HAMP domain-containing histidine kinase [Desulfatitalea sp.]NNJ99330.1 HAMP domain-containing histidine kinase [Desulfatitalea sp.]
LRLGAELSGESLPHDAAAAAKYLQAMGSEIEHMDQLLGELLDYSKINLPNFSLRLNPIDPHTVLEDIYNRYLPVAASKGIELDCLADAPSETLSVDRFRITQVMNNLMDNALHYSAPKAKVTVTCQKQPDGICFRVMDEGPGVPEPLRQKVFDPLFRADPSRSRASGGLGLGLAIAKKIVELHGGRIYCEARHGRTIFAFCIPSRPS